MPKSLASWLDDLLSTRPVAQLNSEQRFIKVKEAARRLGLGHFTCPVITVVGTNGKGSCVATLAAIYQAAGYKTATVTSPHLITFNERICVDGHMAPDEEICEAFAHIAHQCNDLPLSYFHYATLAGLLIFIQKKPDIIILEAGIGGNYDVINVIDADVALISTIDLDHCEILGNTRDEIATCKMGVARDGKPVICGDPSPPPSVAAIAASQHCPYYQLGKAFMFTEKTDDWDWSGPETVYKQLPYPSVLTQNAASALMAIDVLQSTLAVAETAIIQGLRDIKLAGRCQIIRHHPTVVCDVAHNPAAVAVLLKKLQSFSAQGRHFALFGALRHKNVKAMLTPMKAWVDDWYLVDLLHPQAMPSQAIAEILACGQCFNQATEAYEAVMRAAKANDIIVIFGSFYIISQLLSVQ
ncbi:MAG: folylpolyglutamate synthase/dihydrofolate synthase family protein [Pseudomonadota bacterium]